MQNNADVSSTKNQKLKYFHTVNICESCERFSLRKNVKKNHHDRAYHSDHQWHMKRSDFFKKCQHCNKQMSLQIQDQHQWHTRQAES